MHHLKRFTARAIIAKFAIFAVVFVALLYLLKDYVSTNMIILVTHVIVLIVLIAFFVFHRHKKIPDNDHDNQNL